MRMPFLVLGITTTLAVLSSCTHRQRSETSADVCKARSPGSFITALTQDLANRQPTADEMALARAADFTPEGFVDKVVASGLYDDAITKFVSNLFRLDSLVAEGDEERDLISDLKQEPITLVLRNKDKPWRYFFSTRDVFCTKQTAPLYDYPAPAVSGFLSCQLPAARAGFLGLVSVLRVTSPSNNPQAFYRPNNNYHRVAAAYYFASGVTLVSATNGPKGEGKGLPLASCVPTSDVRKSAQGLVFGTAAIPLAGPVCATCHSPHMGPLSVAFRKFGPKGETLKPEAIDNLSEDNAGASNKELKALLAEDGSCWAARDGVPPAPFKGLSGLGEVMAANADFGTALGRQLPQHLANVQADEVTVQAIKKAFDEGGQTLAAALKGFLTSSRYTCE